MRHPSTRLFKCVHLAAQSIDLGPAGDARLNAMTMQVLLHRFAIEVITRLHRDRVRARTNQRHIAAQHINKLRKLVEAEQTQDTSQGSDTRIVSYCALRARRVRAIDMHRAEFDHPNHLVVETEALLHEEHRTPAAQLDQYG